MAGKAQGKVSVYIRPRLLARVDELAQLRHMSRSTLIQMLLTREIDRHDNRKARA